MPVIGGIDIMLVHGLPGKLAEGPAPHPITSLGLGQVGRKVSHVSRVQVKQALVEQGMYREQENSHLEWPDQARSFLGQGFYCFVHCYRASA